MINNDSTIMDYIKQRISNKLYKYDMWLMMYVKIKDVKKLNALKSIYNEILGGAFKRNNYKTHKAFEIVFLNFYLLYKKNMKNGISNMLICHMNKQYYTSRKGYTNIVDIIRILKDNGYIELMNDPYFYIDESKKGECSRFSICDKFKEIIIKFAAGDTVEVEHKHNQIVLRKYEDGKIQDCIDYAETSVIKRIKKEVDAFNKIYSNADIQLDINNVETFLFEHNKEKFCKELMKIKRIDQETKDIIFSLMNNGEECCHNLSSEKYNDIVKIIDHIMNKNIYTPMPDLDNKHVYRVFTNNFKHNEDYTAYGCIIPKEKYNKWSRSIIIVALD